VAAFPAQGFPWAIFRALRVSERAEDAGADGSKIRHDGSDENHPGSRPISLVGDVCYAAVVVSLNS
jgi:hypothetical protein